MDVWKLILVVFRLALAYQLAKSLDYRESDLASEESLGFVRDTEEPPCDLTWPDRDAKAFQYIHNVNQMEKPYKFETEQICRYDKPWVHEYKELEDQLLHGPRRTIDFRLDKVVSIPHSIDWRKKVAVIGIKDSFFFFFLDPTVNLQINLIIISIKISCSSSQMTCSCEVTQGIWRHR